MPAQISDALKRHFEWVCREFEPSEEEASEWDEKKLSFYTVAVRPTKTLSEMPTLLEALGYNTKTVAAEYGAYRMGARLYRVDFLLGTPDKPDHCWMLDLKHPEVECASRGYIEQLQFYMSKSNVPIGVLYNGREAAAIVNPNHKTLSRYREIHEPLRTESVAKTGKGNARELAEFFAVFSRDPGPLNTQDIAKRLTRRYKKMRDDEKRKRAIKAEVARLLRELPGELATALIDLSEILREKSATESEIRASLDELRRTGVTAQVFPPVARRKVQPRLPDLFKAGVIKLGDRLYVQDREGQAAEVRDGTQVIFNGRTMTYN